MMKTFLCAIAGTFGAMVGGFIGSFVGFSWSYLSYRPVPGDNSESASLYTVDVGAFYGGWLGAMLAGLLFYGLFWQNLRRADA